MKTIKAILITIAFVPVLLFAQGSAIRHSAGVSGELGFSNLFLGKNLFSSNMATPLLGGGGGAELFYELQYRHLLVRTGFGFDYTYNRNQMTVPEYTARIKEYPAMTWHYDFDRYTERSGYCVGYIPVMVGGEFNRWFFLAGVKLGVFGLGKTRPVTNATIWAEDPDVIEPLKDLYTHQLTDYKFKGEKKAAGYSPFNLMGSIEVGMNIGKTTTTDDTDYSTLNEAELYQKLHTKKPFKDCLRYRLSLFIDYGFSNLLAGHKADADLIAFNDVSDITPGSIYDYSGHKNAVLNNFLIGVKFAVTYEFPHRVSKSGNMANPLIVTYVSDKLTGEPIGGAKVATRPVEKGSRTKNRVHNSITDSVNGCTTKAWPVGNYKISASHDGYFTKRITFEHSDRYDTVRIALQPLEQLHAQAIDALSGRPVAARIIVTGEKGDTITQTSIDSITHIVSAIADSRKHYSVCASAEGYKDNCVQVNDFNQLQVVSLQPKTIRKFILKNMFFATDKTDILPTSEEALRELYNLLNDNPDIRIRIIGHTDDVGSVEYNQRLSEGRSASVKREMVKRGIDAARIETAGHGELDSIVANDSDEHRQMNRRVEIEILGGGSIDMQISNEQLGR